MDVTATQRSVGDSVVRFIVTPGTGPWDVICHVSRVASTISGTGSDRRRVPQLAMLKCNKYLNIGPSTLYADSCVAWYEAIDPVPLHISFA
jgi:hypothetical protein